MRKLIVVCGVAAFSFAAPRLAAAQDPAAPKILLDQPLRAVEYQLNRLSDEELVLVERNDGDPKYRPVYVALLTRKGVPPQFRDEAVAALVTLDKSSRSAVLLEALAKTPDDQPLVTAKLAAMLLAAPPESLRQERDSFVKTIDTATAGPVLQSAYAALMVADGKSAPAWELAAKHEGHLVQLLRGITLLPSGPAGDALRDQLFAPVAKIATEAADAKDASLSAAAIGALGWTRRDAATFDALAAVIAKTTDDAARAEALRSIQMLPESVWPAAGIEPLARAILSNVSQAPAARRTEPAVLDAIQFGEKLAAKLPDETGRSIRRDLRALGVRVVRIQTIPEKLSFDVKWFAVEAGKPVQIVLFNPDAMPHNLIVGRPGSLEAIGTAGSELPMPTDPTAKAFVPDLGAVLQSTRLLKEGETERLGFTAPKEPGEYIFVCTFPGHWVRMYGVMLVVENLDAWEAKRTVPTDPMTKQPFTSERH